MAARRLSLDGNKHRSHVRTRCSDGSLDMSEPDTTPPDSGGKQLPGDHPQPGRTVYDADGRKYRVAMGRRMTESHIPVMREYGTGAFAQVQMMAAENLSESKPVVRRETLRLLRPVGTRRQLRRLRAAARRAP